MNWVFGRYEAKTWPYGKHIFEVNFPEFRPEIGKDMVWVLEIVFRVLFDKFYVYWLKLKQYL